MAVRHFAHNKAKAGSKSLIALQLIRTDLGCDEQLFRRVVKATFNQRRKMLRVSLRQIFDAAHPAPAGFFEHDIMTRRPEQLSIQEFIALTNMVAKAME